MLGGVAQLQWYLPKKMCKFPSPPVRWELHWMPIWNSIEYKLLTLAYKCPEYLSTSAPIRTPNKSAVWWIYPTNSAQSQTQIMWRLCLSRAAPTLLNIPASKFGCNHLITFWQCFNYIWLMKKPLHCFLMFCHTAVLITYYQWLFFWFWFNLFCYFIIFLYFLWPVK